MAFERKSPWLKELEKVEKKEKFSKKLILDVQKLVEKGAKQIQLCHLSQTNNTPTTALTSIAATAKNVGIVFDKDVKVRVNSRNSVTRPTFF